MISIDQVVRVDKDDGTMDVTVDYTENGNSFSVTQNFFRIPRANYLVSIRPSNQNIYLVDIDDQMLVGDVIAETVLRI